MTGRARTAPLGPFALAGRSPIPDELHAHLRMLVVRGDLAPGDRLVERHVAEVAGVSRTPVREAIKRLERDGLVRPTGGGAEVLAVSISDVVELATIREVLEALATGLAAHSAAEADLLMLEDIIAREERALLSDADATAHIELNHRFHETIWRASRNGHLVRCLIDLRDRAERLQPTTLAERDRAHEALAEHRSILGALRQRDRDGASSAAAEHFRRALVARLALMDDVDSRM